MKEKVKRARAKGKPGRANPFLLVSFPLKPSAVD
jgi:hypothetical protein